MKRFGTACHVQYSSLGYSLTHGASPNQFFETISPFSSSTSGVVFDMYGALWDKLLRSVIEQSAFMSPSHADAIPHSLFRE